MPDFVTKQTPVDTKPYIVYTGEKDADSAMSASGGAKPFNLNFEAGTDRPASIDATYADIVSALSNGMLPFIVGTTPEGYDAYPFWFCSQDDEEERPYMVTFGLGNAALEFSASTDAETLIFTGTAN